MKGIRYFACGLLVMTSVAQAAPDLSSASGPISLTEYQMDHVTAGIVEVSVLAEALALGEVAIVDTDTFTFAQATRYVEVGFGRGSAFACCGPDTYTDVVTNASADGDIVIVRDGSVEIRTPQFSAEKGWISIVSVELPGNLSEKQTNRVLRKANSFSRKLNRLTQRASTRRVQQTINRASRNLNRQIARMSLTPACRIH
jgi:hypothetical protein